MKKLFIILCIVLSAWSFGALPTPVQSQTGTATAANPVATFGVGSTGGNLLVACVGSRSSNSTQVFPSSISDDKGGTWTLIDQNFEVPGTLAYTGSLYYQENCTAGIKAITANGLTTTVRAALVIQEYAITGTGVLDKHTVAAAQGTAASSGSTATTTQANELRVGWVVVGTPAGASVPTTPSPASDQTNASISSGGSSSISATTSDDKVSSTGTQSASYTVSGSLIGWICGIATFKIPAPTTPKGSLLPMMGVG